MTFSVNYGGIHKFTKHGTKVASVSDKFDAVHEATPLPVTGEYVTDPQGVSCPVLDTSRIDFSNSVSGRKQATTLVRRAKEGEGLGQSFVGGQETFQFVTKEGDAIFCE